MYTVYINICVLQQPNKRLWAWEGVSGTAGFRAEEWCKHSIYMWNSQKEKCSKTIIKTLILTAINTFILALHFLPANILNCNSNRCLTVIFLLFKWASLWYFEYFHKS